MKEKYLILWAAIAVAFGIWLADIWRLGPIPLLAGGLFCAALMACTWRRYRMIVWGFFLCLLCLAGMVRMEISESQWMAQSRELSGAEGMYSGVISGGSSQVAGETPYLRYPVALSSVMYGDGSVHSVRGAAYVYVPWDGKSQPLPVDRAVTVRGTLSAVRLYKNPGKMDLQSRYKSERLIGRIYLEKEGDISAGPSRGIYRVAAWAESMKEGLRRQFSPYVDAGRLPLLMTLLFGGNYDELPAGVLESFTATGIVHILSVSGSHMALLFSFICLLGRWLSVPGRVVFPAAAALILFYGALSGFVPPVVRASIMGVLSAAGLLFGREKESILLLGAAVLGMLLWEPLYLFDVSFQLSVGASAGILLFYQPFARQIRRIPWLPRWMAEGASLALSAQILTIPIILYDFHALPLYVVPANLFVTPFLEGTIILGLAASVLVLVLAPLAGGLLQLADYFLWAAVLENGWLAALPGSVLSLGGLAAGETILYYGTILIAYTKSMWIRQSTGRWGAALCMAALLLYNGWVWLRLPETVCFVPDLGASRAVVLSGKGPTLVYYRDSGLPFDMGERELRPVLGYKGIFQIPILIADFREGKNPSSFTLSLPIREIWLTQEGKKWASRFLAAHPESQVRIVEKGELRGRDGTVYATDGKSWCIVRNGTGYYLDGGTLLKERPEASRWLWFGGSAGFQSGVNDDTMKVLKPSYAVYAGSRLPQAGEDRDHLELLSIPFSDPYLDGMVEIGVRNGEIAVENYINKS